MQANDESKASDKNNSDIDQLITFFEKDTSNAAPADDETTITEAVTGKLVDELFFCYFVIV